jgi:hypothetical protein
LPSPRTFNMPDLDECSTLLCLRAKIGKGAAEKGFEYNS